VHVGPFRAEVVEHLFGEFDLYRTFVLSAGTPAGEIKDWKLIFDFRHLVSRQCSINVVKLLRVYGGCLGIERRRKTW
jgi:hypothetical protein